MTTEVADGPRSEALDAYLAARTAQGYRIETRTPLQAVIARGPLLPRGLRWLGRGRGQRLVVSVDQHGEVTAVAAEPVRW